MASRKPSTAKTSAELKQQLETAKKRVALLEQLAYAEELTELIRTTSIATDFAKIQVQAKGIQPTAILQAIGNVVGIKRLVVSLSAPIPRKPADPSKAKNARKSKSK
jgi:endonuclease V-like protein UPF0215 family